MVPRSVHPPKITAAMARKPRPATCPDVNERAGAHEREQRAAQARQHPGHADRLAPPAVHVDARHVGRLGVLADRPHLEAPPAAVDEPPAQRRPPAPRGTWARRRSKTASPSTGMRSSSGIPNVDGSSPRSWAPLSRNDVSPSASTLITRPTTNGLAFRRWLSCPGRRPPPDRPPWRTTAPAPTPWLDMRGGRVGAHEHHPLDRDVQGPGSLGHQLARRRARQRDGLADGTGQDRGGGGLEAHGAPPRPAPWRAGAAAGAPGRSGTRAAGSPPARAAPARRRRCRGACPRRPAPASSCAAHRRTGRPRGRRPAGCGR